MSYQRRLRDMFDGTRLDTTLAAVGLVTSVALAGLWLVTLEPLVVVVPVSTGAACGFYLLAGNRHVPAVRAPTIPRWLEGYLPALVVAGLAGFVAVVWIAGQRTLPAYLLAGGTGALVFLQVLLVADDRLEPGSVLGQILLAAVVIRFAGLVSTPGFVGVDVWTHLRTFVPGIVESGSLSAIAESKYVMAPLYHAFASVATLVFGATRPGVYLTLGLLVPLSVLFVYGAAGLLLPVRWALLATALYAFADEFILWGLHLIPTSLGLVFFLALVYCLTRLLVADVEGWVVALLATFSLAVVFTHQLSTAIALLVLGVAAGTALAADAARDWPFSVAVSRKTVALVGVFAATTVVTFVSWANTPFTGDTIFLWRVLELAVELIGERAGFLNLVGGSGPAADGSATILDTLVPFLELVGFGLLLAAAVVGGLAMLRREAVGADATYLVSASVLFLGTFGVSTFGVRVFLPDRWVAFLYVFMVVLAAAGLYHVFESASTRAILAVVVVVALCYPTTMVVAKRATYDSPAFADQHERFSYTEAELAGVRTIGAIHPPSVAEGVHSDHPYQTIFEPVGGYEASGTLPIGEGGAVSPFPVVYREYQSTGPAGFAVPGERSDELVRRTAPASAVCPPERDLVYANDQVGLCLPTGAGPGGGA